MTLLPTQNYELIIPMAPGRSMSYFYVFIIFQVNSFIENVYTFINNIKIQTSNEFYLVTLHFRCMLNKMVHCFPQFHKFRELLVLGELERGTSDNIAASSFVTRFSGGGEEPEV